MRPAVPSDHDGGNYRNAGPGQGAPALLCDPRGRHVMRQSEETEGANHSA
jgi:hypothetical protein